ncbi:MAG: hypothetical protein ACFB6S_15830 [Geminicoccaceae bacterium]
MQRFCAMLALLTGLLAAAPASAAVLVDATYLGRALRIVAESDQSLVKVTLGDRVRMIDLARGLVASADGRVARMPSAESPGATDRSLTVEAWSPGPAIAGYSSSYQVVMNNNRRVCAEVLANDAVRRKMEPVIQAMAVIQLLDGSYTMNEPAPGCGPVPFEVLASQGWPLMAGEMEKPAFTTRRLDLSYRPAPREMIWPGR